MPTWQFGLDDRMSGPASQADRALEGLEKELKSTEKALGALNKTAKQIQLNKSLGLDITKQQKEHTKSVMDGLRAERIRISMQRDSIKAERNEALPAHRAAVREQREAIRAATQTERHMRSLARQHALIAKEQRVGLTWGQQLRNALSPTRAFESATGDLSRKLRSAAENGGFFRSSMSGIGSMLGTFATATAAVGAGIAALGANFVVSTARAADFGESQRRNLMTRFGAVEGARQYEVLLDYSNRFGTSLEDTFRQFNLLSTKGFNQPQILAMMQGAGDVATVMGHQAADSILVAVSQIKGKGVAQMEELQQQLAERGINIESVLSEIGRGRGVSGSQVRQLISGGQIQAMEAIPAIFRTIQRDFSQGGPMGTAMMARTQTMAGRIDLITARWEIFKTRVGETSAFQPVNEFLGKVAEMMDGNTESGRRFQSVLNDMFKGLFGDLSQQDPVKLFRDFGDALKNVAEVAKGVAGVVGAIASAYRYLSSIGNGQDSSEESRAIEGGIRERGEANWRTEGTSWWDRWFGGADTSASMARLGGDAAGPAVAPVPPSGARVNTMNAQRTVNISGGINVSVEGLADGTTAEQIGQQVDEQISRSLSSAAASQGGPG